MSLQSIKSAITLLFVTLVLACGSRTPLHQTDAPAPPVTHEDAGRLENGSAESERDPTPAVDASSSFDERAHDSGSHDAEANGDSFWSDGRRSDVFIPDARVDPDAFSRQPCFANESRLVYLITGAADVLTFDTDSYEVISRTHAVCPTSDAAFSMALSQDNVIYSLFADAAIYRIDRQSGYCVRTAFAPRASGPFDRFGMAFVSEPESGRKVLFVLDPQSDPSGQRGLATIDTDQPSLDLHRIAPLSPRLDSAAELTGTPDGRLFVLAPMRGAARILPLDKSTARLGAAAAVDLPSDTGAFAFAYLPDEFWIFSSPRTGGTTRVHRYNPTTASPAQQVVAMDGRVVVGAGVANCADAGW
jgi:hypothetical protein